MRPAMRRATGVALLAAFVIAGCAPRPPRREPAGTGAVVTGFRTTVSDLEASTAFFTQAIGATVEYTVDLVGVDLDDLLARDAARLRTRMFDLGAERLQLQQAPGDAPAPAVPRARSNDLDFQHLALVVSDMDRMHERVMQWPVTPVSIGGPQRLPDTNIAAAGIRAFYFRDRDARPLELIWYPPGKGRRAWHVPGPRLLLGVDHTAIAVADTARSLAFYEDLLGLSRRGESLNEGPEQEALSGVSGARVRITGLGGASGPGIELLQYERPGAGARPPLKTPADAGYWEVSVYLPAFDEVVDRVRRAGVRIVSRRVVACEACVRGTRAIVVLDPDGHAVRLVGDRAR